jgi:hypothetical protein
MAGSDGTSLDGMYHEEHALPSFVHARSRDQLRLPAVMLKGETPVIYFYTQQPQSVRVGVSFPHGVWTQWYPQAARVFPAFDVQASAPERLKNGRICWFADIFPTHLIEQRLKTNSGEIPSLPTTSTDALWNFARDVDAAFVKTVDSTRDPAAAEYERFLFYRGLGEARLPLRLNAERGGTLTLDHDPTLADGIRHVYVIKIENGRGIYTYRPGIRPGWTVNGVIPSGEPTEPLASFSKTIAADLASRLTASGLYAKEARAMVNTWTSSYFQSDGIRVLFVLPQSWTNAFIPMDVYPKPQQLVRVMVGRIELLTSQREALAESAVRSLADPSSSTREQAFDYLRNQGRYVEPIIRRVLRTTHDANVKTLCRRLLLTDFVSELRAAVHNASDGKRSRVDPVLLRAHLARLLREIGLEAEAKTAGTEILRSLDVQAKSGAVGTLESLENINNDLLLGQFQVTPGNEAKAVAFEALGDNLAASRAFADMIGKYAETYTGDLNVTAIAWLQDWSVGRGYGRSTVRAGRTKETISNLEATLASGPSAVPSRQRQSRLMLAYLHEAMGNEQKASGIWASLAGTPEQRNADVVNVKAIGSAGSPGF